jgi:predicted DNA-binding helix-hairpin-helix protein
MIVGATPSTDAQILQTADALYRRHSLRRVYYSAYSPIPHGDDRLPPEPPPLMREHRLYQSDWLLRFYGFEVSELTTSAEPNLPLTMDPKLAWAIRNRGRFPVDLNRAPREMLLRIPGLGVRNVERILQIRRHQQVRLDDLQKMRAPMRKIRPFVVTADHNPAASRIDHGDLAERVVTPHVQLELFSAASSARSGEV